MVCPAAPARVPDVIYMPLQTVPSAPPPARYAPPVAITPMPAQVPDRVAPPAQDIVPLKIVPVNPS